MHTIPFTKITAPFMKGTVFFAKDARISQKPSSRGKICAQIDRIKIENSTDIISLRPEKTTHGHPGDQTPPRTL